jgi:hypothetical protein
MPQRDWRVARDPIREPVARRWRRWGDYPSSRAEAGFADLASGGNFERKLLAVPGAEIGPSHEGPSVNQARIPR